MKEIFVSPSILSSDFCEIGNAVKVIEDAGAQWVHCDVMDGLFVPNLTFGYKMVEDIRKITKLTLDVHLMIVDPERYIKQFAEAGADIITVHIEAADCVRGALEKIRGYGKRAGIAIKPDTPAGNIAEYLDIIDMIVVMSVQPGFSGQKFNPVALSKMRQIKEMIGSRNILIQGDGGINGDNIKDVIAAGADSVVAGNMFFLAEDKTAAVKTLKGF